MRLKTMLMALVTAVLLSGCTAPSLIEVKDGRVSAQPAYPKYVTDIRNRVNSNGLLEVQIVFQSPRSRTIDYKIEWLDAQGYVLRNPIDERYRALRLVRNEAFVLSKIANDKRAKDIKIHIK